MSTASTYEEEALNVGELLEGRAEYSESGPGWVGLQASELPNTHAVGSGLPTCEPAERVRMGWWAARYGKAQPQYPSRRPGWNKGDGKDFWNLGHEAGPQTSKGKALWPVMDQFFKTNFKRVTMEK